MGKKSCVDICDPYDEARYHDPIEDLYADDDEYDARVGDMSGQPKLTGNVTRKTLMQQRRSRPRIDHLPEDIGEPPLEEGIPFSQRLVNEDDPYPPY